MSTSESVDRDIEKKMPDQINSYSPSVSDGEVLSPWRETLASLRQTFLTKEGWIGDYVRLLIHIGYPILTYSRTTSTLSHLTSGH
jgi:hypothetical protein